MTQTSSPGPLEATVTLHRVLNQRSQSESWWPIEAAWAANSGGIAWGRDRWFEVTGIAAAADVLSIATLRKASVAVISVELMVRQNMAASRSCAKRASTRCLGLLAYNLGNLWRRLAPPGRIENWSLTRLQQRRVKTGGRLVQHARYYWLSLTEGHLNRRRCGMMLGRIALLPVLTG
jgi:hypothetical protein